jgi:hypothetical protein
VTGWNTSDHVQQATMSTWDIPAGEWEMRVGQGAVHVTLERSASVPVEFAAHGETVLDFRLVRPGDPVDRRPDLGIGRDDVTVAKGHVEVTVHSLGAVATGGGSVALLGADGAVLATQPLVPMAAPVDLLPRTQVVRFPLRSDLAGKGFACAWPCPVMRRR